MAQCTPPSVNRAGFAFLEYGLISGVVSHKVTTGLQLPYDPSDLALIFPEVDLWGDAVARCLPTTMSVTGWGTQNADHSAFSAASFGSPKLGTHGGATGAVDSYSATLTMTGRAVAGFGLCAGEMRHVLFVGRSLEFQPGQKSLGTGVDSNFDDLATFLAAQAVLWADFYGNHGGVRGKYPVQQNAAAQRRIGH